MDHDHDPKPAPKGADASTERVAPDVAPHRGAVAPTAVAPMRQAGGAKLRDALPSDDESDALLDSLFADVTAPPAAVAGPPDAEPDGPPTPRREALAPTHGFASPDALTPSREAAQPSVPATITIPAPALSAAVASEHELSVPRDDDDLPEEATALIDVDVARVLAESTRLPDLRGLVPDDPAERSMPSETPLPSIRPRHTPAPSAVRRGPQAAPVVEDRVAPSAERSHELAAESDVVDLDADGQADVVAEAWEGADELPSSEPGAPSGNAAPADVVAGPLAPKVDGGQVPVPVQASPVSAPVPSATPVPSSAVPSVPVEAVFGSLLLAGVPSSGGSARTVAAAMGDEAASRVGASNDRDGWLGRVVWFRAEAAVLDDSAARSRMLLVASELAALAGDESLALEVASEARELAAGSPLVQRQVRGLLTRAAEWTSAIDALDAEARLAPTPTARAHAALVAAEILRQKLDDREAAGKRLDAAARALPGDPRPPLQRFCDALADADLAGTPSPGAALARIRVPDASGLAPLAGAFMELSVCRASSAELAAKIGWARPREGSVSAHEFLLRARAALGSGDRAAAIGWVEALSRVRGLEGGAGWLAGVLAAPRPETRARALASLRGVVSGSHGALASRAVAARALELGDGDATRAALDGASASAFSAADRIALGALGGATRQSIEAFVEDASGEPGLVPLVVAATGALSEPEDPERVVRALGSPRASAAVKLGRALAAGPKVGTEADESADRAYRVGVAGALHAYAEAAPEAGVSRALALELDVEAGAVGKVARALSMWSDANLTGPAYEAERDRALAGALVAELAGEKERAVSDYERACALDAGHEGAVRARASFLDPEAVARSLVDLAGSVGGGSRASLLLVEAALRLANADADVEVDLDAEVQPEGEAEPLFRKAAEADPRLPFAPHFGEKLARARGDRERVLEWIRLRREASDDAVEQALDLVREALLRTDVAGAAPAELLERALRARPADAGLRELFERLSPELPADRAEWRIESSARAEGAEAARLAIEAAFELERTGDLMRASDLAHQAVLAGDAGLAPILVHRAALAGYGANELVEELSSEARALTTPAERLEVHERLAELEEAGRKDPAGALRWRRAILEEVPDHLPTLRRVVTALAAEGRDAEVEPVALAIAKALDGPESTAHAILSARLRLRGVGWEEMREPLEVAYQREPRALWVLRQVASHATARGDFAVAADAQEQLAARVERPLEGATLLLRAAQAAKRAGALERARELLDKAVDLAPQHVLVQLERAEVLAALGENAAAAEAFEASAEVSAVPEEAVSELYRAAVLWGDAVKDVDRARAALERVTATNPAYEDAFDRLRALYLAQGARAELAALLERRLDSVTDPHERVEMEVLRGRTLAEVGDVGTAKRALARALEDSPDHVDALDAFADVCASEGDWTGAEQALIRLARLVADPGRQASLYLRLGGLYDEHLPNPERAELAYQEILKRTPSDETARERLVALYQRTGDTRSALEQQTALVNVAETPEAKCKRTVELAGVYESSNDLKKAESTLLSARKTWPKDDAALVGLAQFLDRTGQAPAAHVLLDRAVADARRALSTGRFEPYLFGTLATVAMLRDRPDAARVAQSIVAALDGADALTLDGAALRAGDLSLDDLLAPDVLTPAFRDLLRSTGPLLDTAVPYDLTSIRATPLPVAHAALGEEIRQIAAAYGILALHVQVSGVLGSVCVAASAHPPTLVLGQALVTSPRADVREFLVHRAMKVLQANAAVLSRTAPIDLWPLVAAYLRTLVPSFSPPGVDAAKLGDWQSKLAKVAPPPGDAQTSLLATDVIGTIGNRASMLNTIVNGWGDRTALLAVGDPNVALSGIAAAGGHLNAPPPSGKERVTWIGRNTEARELVVYAVSDAFAELRARLGLGS